MIRDEKRSEVEEELRKQVDVLMREELDLLKIVSWFLTALLRLVIKLTKTYWEMKIW